MMDSACCFVHFFAHSALYVKLYERRENSICLRLSILVKFTWGCRFIYILSEAKMTKETVARPKRWKIRQETSYCSMLSSEHPDSWYSSCCDTWRLFQNLFYIHTSLRTVYTCWTSRDTVRSSNLIETLPLLRAETSRTFLSPPPYTYYPHLLLVILPYILQIWRTNPRYSV